MFKEGDTVFKIVYEEVAELIIVSVEHISDIFDRYSFVDSSGIHSTLLVNAFDCENILFSSKKVAENALLSI